jgi:cytochrome c biogenesis protein CcdA
MLHNDRHAAGRLSFDQTSYQQHVSHLRRISAHLNQSPNLKRTLLMDQKGLMIVTMFFVITGILIIGISYIAGGLEQRIRNSVLLVGSMITFMGISVFMLTLSFAFLKHRNRKVAGAGVSSGVEVHRRRRASHA